MVDMPGIEPGSYILSNINQRTICIRCGARTRASAVKGQRVNRFTNRTCVCFSRKTPPEHTNCADLRFGAECAVIELPQSVYSHKWPPCAVFVPLYFGPISLMRRAWFGPTILLLHGRCVFLRLVFSPSCSSSLANTLLFVLLYFLTYFFF